MLFDEKGPHPSVKGTPHAVSGWASHGPIWGVANCLNAGAISSNFGNAHTSPDPAFGNAYTTPCRDYPSWTLNIDPLTVTRVQVYRLVDGPPLPAPVTIADVQATMTKMKTRFTTSMDAAKMERTSYKMERTSEQRVRKLALEQKADAAALSVQVAALSKGHGDDTRNATTMRDLQATIVRMGAELADAKVSLLSSMSAPKAPCAFWACLLDVSSEDPAVQSTATAFKVTPLAEDVDGLKDAVAAKMMLGLAAPRLEVWAHDAASNRWVPVDEDSALVANDKATAYHVVVPKVGGGVKVNKSG